jgi:glucose/arabinose dehydrogenase
MTRRVLAFIALLALLASGCARVPAPRKQGSPQAGGITAHAVKTGLNTPAAFTFAPNGRIFFGELTTGNIRILNPSTGNTPLFFHVPNVANSGEQGLLGIALHPDFPTSPYVYAYAPAPSAATSATRSCGSRTRAGRAQP